MTKKVTSQYPAGASCTVDGCERAARRKWLCTMHYQRLRRGAPLGGPDAVPQWQRSKRQSTRNLGLCEVAGCSEPACAREMCGMHYQAWRSHGDPEAGRKYAKRGFAKGYVDNNGYVVVYVRGEKARTKQLEHRYVMEQVLGRPLDGRENVHHRNGIRSDNRPENLELWVTPQPQGQRAEDLVEWVVEHYPDLARVALERRV